jgi:hypothetical protein
MLSTDTIALSSPITIPTSIPEARRTGPKCRKYSKTTESRDCQTNQHVTATTPPTTSYARGIRKTWKRPNVTARMKTTPQRLSPKKKCGKKEKKTVRSHALVRQRVHRHSTHTTNENSQGSASELFAQIKRLNRSEPHCSSCNVGLCLQDKRNVFFYYHQKQLF